MAIFQIPNPTQYLNLTSTLLNIIRPIYQKPNIWITVLTFLYTYRETPPVFLFLRSVIKSVS